MFVVFLTNKRKESKSDPRNWNHKSVIINSRHVIAWWQNSITNACVVGRRIMHIPEPHIAIEQTHIPVSLSAINLYRLNILPSYSRNIIPPHFSLEYTEQRKLWSLWPYLYRVPDVTLTFAVTAVLQSLVECVWAIQTKLCTFSKSCRFVQMVLEQESCLTKGRTSVTCCETSNPHSVLPAHSSPATVNGQCKLTCMFH